MYEKCPHKEDDQDQVITIFDEGESIKITANPESFTPPDPNMILTVTDNTSTDANHYLDKDMFVLLGVVYVIDDEHLTKPQIYLSPQQIKQIQLKDHSLAIIISKLSKNKIHSTPLPNTYFQNEEGVLYQSVREGYNHMRLWWYRVHYGNWYSP